MRITAAFIALILTCSLAEGQVSGESTFGALQLPSGARSSALGGITPALSGDITLTADNPALLDSVKTGDFALSYSPFFGGINYLNLSSALKFSPVGAIAIGLAYVDYGNLNETDNLGNELGTFSPKDFVARVTKSHRIGPFVLGVSLKFAHASIAGFGSGAFAADIGGIYQKPGSQFVFGMVLKNLGSSFSTFGSTRPNLPLDLHMGISFKPQYMPARFSISAYNFVDSDLSYFKNSTDDAEDPSAFQEAFRHINLGMELLIGKALNLQIGYNHLRNQELRLAQGGFGAGFSYGLMVRIKKLEIRFARATYHTSGGMNTLSVQGNISRLKKIF